jgi:hypothetical protein
MKISALLMLTPTIWPIKGERKNLHQLKFQTVENFVNLLFVVCVNNESLMHLFA